MKKACISVIALLLMFSVLCISNRSFAETEALTAVSINRVYSTYSETSSSGQKLRYKMNCYGYAIQVYSVSGTENSSYGQQPGEFADDDYNYNELMIEYINFLLLGTSASNALNRIKGLIFADFSTLSGVNSEWVIETSSAIATVPSGYRKIALTIDLGLDFHFYLRHSDGKWSHKQGSNVPTNLSIDTHVQITDSNISSVISEGGYNDGARYYLIKKSAIADYQHKYGHGNNIGRTLPNFKDRAGDYINKATTINTATVHARFDYTSDNDYYAYKPTTSGNYTFTTTAGLSTCNIEMIIYDSSGSVIAIDASPGNPSITVNLTANNQYFIRIYDSNNQVTTYDLIRN